VEAREAAAGDDHSVLREGECECREHAGDHQKRRIGLVRRFNVITDGLGTEDEHSRPGYARRTAAVDEAIGGVRIGGAVYELEAGERICPYHYHHGVEEWLVVVAGRPTLRTPDGEQELRAGDVVCFPGSPEGAHTVHGPGRVLMLSHEVWPAVVVYPDSDKLGTRPGPWGTHNEDRLNFPRYEAVDYWHGEQ
jgi:uncharacterized cupin superfamily protein